MSTNLQTPGQVAKAWASSHNDFAGTLMIQSKTRKGRGGRRGLTDRWNTFFVREGKAAQTRDRLLEAYPIRREEGPGQSISVSIRVYAHNGECDVCGSFFLDPVLRFAWADDPDAGKPVEVTGSSSWDGWTDIRSDKAYVRACPACISEHDLSIEPERSVSWFLDHENQVRAHTRPHPTLGLANSPSRLITLDIRAGEPYTETETEGRKAHG